MSGSISVTSEAIQQAVAARLGTNEFRVLDVKAEPAFGGVVGFAGDHLRVQVLVSTCNEQCQPLHFFSKAIPASISTAGLTYFVNAYNRESAFYSVILKNLRVALSEVESCSCKCYFTGPNHHLLLEDLSSKGFMSLSSRTIMDFDHCSLVLRRLAIFHAASIIFEESQTGKSGSMRKMWTTLINQDFEIGLLNGMHDGWSSAGLNSIIDVLKLMDNIPGKENLMCRLEESKIRFRKQYFLLRKPSELHRNVVCHGDLWANNILFRYAEDGRPADARVVDFQLIRLRPPVYDVLCFLHLTTRRAFRDANLDVLLGLYHDALTQALRSRGLEPAACDMSRESFLASCEDQRSDARLVAAMLHPKVLLDSHRLHKILSTPESADKFINEDRSQVVCDSFREDNEYKIRVTETLSEFVTNCL